MTDETLTPPVADAEAVRKAELTAEGERLGLKFDKRFSVKRMEDMIAEKKGEAVAPPAAPAVTQPDEGPSLSQLAAELAALRQKARLWDAVGSGKVVLLYDDRELFAGRYDKEDSIGWQTGWFPTAEEAVEAAIAAGALK